MNTFRLEVASPDALSCLDGVTFLDVPAVDGRLTVLPGHQPTICALKSGPVYLRTAPAGNEQTLSIDEGVMTVSPTLVRIVTRRPPALDDKAE